MNASSTSSFSVSTAFAAWAKAVETTLRQAEEWGGEAPAPAPADLYGAFLALSVGREGDAPPVKSRRLTCGAIATSLAAAAKFTPGNARECAAWFTRVSEGARKASAEAPDDQKGRLSAIAGTWAREATELGG